MPNRYLRYIGKPAGVDLWAQAMDEKNQPATPKRIAQVRLKWGDLALWLRRKEVVELENYLSELVKNWK